MYLAKFWGARNGLVADPSMLLLIVLSPACAVEFLSNFKPVVLNRASQKWLLAACLVLFSEDSRLSCRSAAQLYLKPGFAKLECRELGLVVLTCVRCPVCYSGYTSKSKVCLLGGVE